MSLVAETFPVRFDPRLVETVLLEVAQTADFPESDRFRRERDSLYEMQPGDLREAGFQEFDARWFKKLGLGADLLQLLREHSTLATGISRCYVLPAGSHRDEGADLHAPRDELDDPRLPVLVIRLLPKTLLDTTRLTSLLRHELLHVTDMLDPQFGYEPTLPDLSQGPMFQRLIQDRYRVLWNTTVDGRLAKANQLPPQQMERRRREFLDSFTMLGRGGEQHFNRFFSGRRPTHREMVAFAVAPPGRHDRGSCPLCRLPASQLHPNAAGLQSRVVEAIRADFPQWDGEKGLCLQCANLYEARACQ